MKKSIEEIIKMAEPVRPLTEIIERECLARLAQEVDHNGKSIVEIGCLYGGMTAVLGIAAPNSQITTIDDFSWHPEDDVPTSADLLLSNMKKVGVSNVQVLEGDSRRIGINWFSPIDLLWVDGGHSYDYVFMDLMLFGVRAKTIALHDFGNPFWATIKQAIEDFLRLTDGMFILSEVAGTVAVLRRTEGR